MGLVPIFQSLRYPIYRRINPFKKRHTEDHRLSSNRSNEKGILLGNAAKGIRKNNRGITIESGLAVSQSNLRTKARPYRNLVKGNNGLVNKINRRTRVNQCLVRKTKLRKQNRYIKQIGKRWGI